jgi:hypothetical protein
MSETRGQIACPICNNDKPHWHDPHEVELERYCRPAFERWAKNLIRHIGQGSVVSIMVHYGMVPAWDRRDSHHYAEHEVEVAWQAFQKAWFASDAVARRPSSLPATDRSGK